MSNPSGSIVPLIGRVLMSLVFHFVRNEQGHKFSDDDGLRGGRASSASPRFACHAPRRLRSSGGLPILTGFHTKVHGLDRVSISDPDHISLPQFLGHAGRRPHG